ncbi:hypothetical protein Csa_022365 [Cucumis sativus]|uniref:Uncharacterized protein n=1 Tax=Cucumis sativus TaxID=3659 RepID=A0A0A0LMX9_CUCSA|nr:hypothetical protein Csa_022365 [Cucumis sativus]
MGLPLKGNWEKWVGQNTAQEKNLHHSGWRFITALRSVMHDTQESRSWDMAMGVACGGYGDSN